MDLSVLFLLAITCATLRALAHRITARRRRVTEKDDNTRHFLDTVGDHPSILHLSTYLRQWQWRSWIDTSGDVYLYDLIVTLCTGKGLTWRLLGLPVLGLLPRKLFGSQPVFSSQPGSLHDPLQKITRILEANSLTFDGMAWDLYGYIKSKHSTSLHRMLVTTDIMAPIPFIPTTLTGSDAVNDLFCLPRIDKIPTNANEFQSTVESRTSTNPLPHSLEYDCPEPILPDVFPGLCIGWGGLCPMQTPYVAGANHVICDVLNRLTANLYIITGLVTDKKLYIFNHAGEEIVTPKQFMSKIPGIRVFFSRNSSSFGLMACVKQPGYGKNLDKRNPDSLHAYRQIPMSWPTRVALRDPRDGTQLSVMAYHNSLVIEGHAEKCPLGMFRAQFFLGPDGCTSWKPGNEYIRSWAPLMEQVLDQPHEQENAIDLATALSCVMNWAASRSMGLHLGGYGIFGTCMDSTAMIQLALWGKCTGFPLGINGDARAEIVRVCRLLMIPRLAVLEQDNGPWSSMVSNLRLLATAAITMPNDFDVNVRDVVSTCQRLEASCIGAFVGVERLRGKAVEVEKYWGDVLAEEDG